MNTINVIVKPFNYCNQNCLYCFDKDMQRKPRLIDKDDLLAWAEKLMHEFDVINWIWHGGEPTLLPIDWFEEVMFQLLILREKTYRDVIFSFQTNGILLNDEWIKILARYNVILSISYDIKCDDRINVIDKNSKYLHQTPGTISVITKNNIDYLKDLYEEGKTRNQCVSLNWPFATKHQTLQDILGDEDEALDKYLDFIKYYLYDKNGTEERNVNSLIMTALGRDALICNHTNCVFGSIICVTSDGRIWKCDNNNYNELLLGHINTYTCFEDLNIIEKMHPFACFDEAECRECEWSPTCGRGCLHCRINESNGKKPYSFHCKMVKKIIPFLYNTLYNLTPEEFVKLNPAVRTILIESKYLPAYIVDDLWTQFS